QGTRELRRALSQQQPDAGSEGTAARSARSPERVGLSRRLLLLPPALVYRRRRPLQIGPQGGPRLHRARCALLLLCGVAREAATAGGSAAPSREARAGVREERVPGRGPEAHDRAQDPGRQQSIGRLMTMRSGTFVLTAAFVVAVAGAAGAQTDRALTPLELAAAFAPPPAFRPPRRAAP